jgi:hypothetical protein
MAVEEAIAGAVGDGTKTAVDRAASWRVPKGKAASARRRVFGIWIGIWIVEW